MKAQRGNILFLILLAVVLFAALAYAVTSSMRGGGNDVSKESNASLAAQLMNYNVQLEQTIMRMTLSGGIRPEHLDFADANGQGDNAANSNCATNACKVFHVDGGGMRAMATPSRAVGANVVNNLTTGGVKSVVLLASVKNIGTEKPDILQVFRGVNDAICNEINVKMGVYAEGQSPIADNLGVGNSGGTSGTHFASFVGAMDPIPDLVANVLGDADGRHAGKTTFCFARGGGAGNYLFHVIYPL